MHLAAPRSLVALALLALVAAPASPASRLTVPYEMFRLPNGLTVILHEDHSAPVVSVNFWYHVGSARETPGRTGFAHLFEHLMFEGSKHVPEGEFDRWLEAVGGNNNGSTSRRPHQLLRERARRTRSSWRSSSSPIAWATCSTR